MAFKKIFDRVLERIRPSAAERKEALRHVDAFVSLLNAELKRLAISAKAIVGGSYAKDTWISGDFDVDVFVRFDLKYVDKKDISDLLESALLQFDPVRLHGSRDYFQVKDCVNFEIVPVLDIRKPSDARNVTDFSPLHVAWANKHGKSLKDDIRLAKCFFKSAGCYGAESYIQGFSGHVVDILIIYYGGFLKLLRAASRWEPKVVIDPENKFKGKALFHLNTSKIEGPLVIVDPVQPDRNAAAALNSENFDRFVSAASKFLRSPSEMFFVEKRVDLSRADFIVDVVTIKAKVDVAGAKMVRAFEFVRDHLSDFGVKDSGWFWDKREKAVWYFMLKNLSLPVSFEHKGPPVGMPEAVAEFTSKYPDAFERDGRLWAVVDREFSDAKSALSSLLDSAFVAERVVSASLRRH